MHLGPPLVADEQAFEVVQPGEGALDHPAVAAESGAVLGLAASDERLDPSLAQQSAVSVGVVAAVGDQRFGPPARPPDAAANGGHRLHKRQQLLDVVAIGAGQAPGERDAARIDEEMLLGARPGSINRARARLGAPFFAWI